MCSPDGAPAIDSLTTMKRWPDGVEETGVREALAEWGIDAASLAYAPVGFGDYHWNAVDVSGRWLFVTVVDLGRDPAPALAELRQAMDTAAALRDDFVVAPLRSVRGETARILGSRHAVSVFPYVEGTPGHFGQALTPRERGRVLDMLADLHRATPPHATPVPRLQPAARARLEEGLAETDRPWEGGPYAEATRALVAEHSAALRRRLAEFDALAAELDRESAEPVVTHGEPHPGNLVWQDDRCLLVDWKAVGMAVPERDLWMVATGPDDLARYAERTGRTPDPVALALYRLRWALDDVAGYVNGFRSPHIRDPDTDQAWSEFTDTAQHLADDFAWPSDPGDAAR